MIEYVLLVASLIGAGWLFVSLRRFLIEMAREDVERPLLSCGTSMEDEMRVE